MNLGFCFGALLDPPPPGKNVFSSQLLSTIIETIQGPCPGNQAQVARSSDVITVVNMIMNARNPLEEELASKDDTYKDLRGLGCSL